jgi:hypothetical protein
VKRRLFIDSEILQFLADLEPSVRRMLNRRFDLIRDFPDQHAEFTTREGGRDLAGCIEGDYAILFWDDFADRHVKIMRVVPADEIEEG